MSFSIKKGDLLPELTETLTDGAGNAIDLTTATVELRWRNKATGITESNPATVVTPLTGEVKYTWAAGDTDTPGVYETEWVVTEAGGDRTIPSNAFGEFTIYDTLATKTLPTLVKEDGTQPVGANSYASVDDADSYHAGHLYSSTWDAADAGRKVAALIMATRLIDQQVQFSGVKTSAEQSLQWPRRYCTDPDIERGFIFGASYYSPRWSSGYNSKWVDERSVPKLVVEATCELARRMMVADRTADPDSEGIRSLSIGGALRIDFDKSDRQRPLPREVITMLSKYGRVSGSGGMVPVMRT